MAASKEEQIIRKRLLTQTAVGHKGDPPLTKLSKKYLKLCEQALSGAPISELEELYSQLLRDNANIEFHGQKQEAICAAHRSEQASFVEKKRALELEVETARRDIEQRKRDLVTAREVRQHNEEYEHLRARVVKLPRCDVMEAEIAREEAGLAEATAAVAKASRTVHLRKKQFALLLHTIGSLKDEVDEVPSIAGTATTEPTTMETDM